MLIDSLNATNISLEQAMFSGFSSLWPAFSAFKTHMMGIPE